MTTHQIIEAARASRFMPTPNVCACCGGALDTDATQTHRAGFVQKMRETYMGPVCSECADEHDTCADCARPFVHAELQAVGDDHFCDNCSDAARFELRLHEGNQRAEVRAWEGQR